MTHVGGVGFDNLLIAVAKIHTIRSCGESWLDYDGKAEILAAPGDNLLQIVGIELFDGTDTALAEAVLLDGFVSTAFASGGVVARHVEVGTEVVAESDTRF